MWFRTLDSVLLVLMAKASTNSTYVLIHISAYGCRGSGSGGHASSLQGTAWEMHRPLLPASILAVVCPRSQLVYWGPGICKQTDRLYSQLQILYYRR